MLLQLDSASHEAEELLQGRGVAGVGKELLLHCLTEALYNEAELELVLEGVLIILQDELRRLRAHHRAEPLH